VWHLPDHLSCPVTGGFVGFFGGHLLFDSERLTAFCPPIMREGSEATPEHFERRGAICHGFVDSTPSE
jgi:hypothetical protein